MIQISTIFEITKISTKSEFTNLPSEYKITEMPLQSTMTEIYPTVMGKLGLDISRRAKFNSAGGDLPHAATDSDRTFKVVDPLMANYWQIDYSGSSGWSEMTKKDMGNKT